MEVENHISLLEDILGKWEDVIGKDYKAYKNHVYRVTNFCYALQADMTDNDKEKIIIAGCFHDLGIWSNNTFNYLSPSVKLAKAYLSKSNKETWFPEIGLMIKQHHKITQYNDNRYPLVNIFRKADWIDVSKGKRSFGLSKSVVNDVINTFPNLGFHKKIIKLTKAEFIKHPLNPLPMMKW